MNIVDLDTTDELILKSSIYSFDYHQGQGNILCIYLQREQKLFSRQA